MTHPAIVISSLALAVSVLSLGFTLGSFYWMNWRKGKLRVSGPLLAFGACGSENEHLMLLFPFVFFNDGARPIVVEDLRVLFLGDSNLGYVRFSATYADFKVNLGLVERKLPTQFPVRGREAMRLICEFLRKPGRLLFKVGTYPLELQAKLDQSHTWVALCRFNLNISEYCLPTINGILRTYHLDPETVRAEVGHPEFPPAK